MYYRLQPWSGKIIDTNLRGYFYCARFAGRHMLANQKGSIIMTSSIAGSLGVPGLTPYAASKGGINQLVVITLRKHLKLDNSINPINLIN